MPPASRAGGYRLRFPARRRLAPIFWLAAGLLALAAGGCLPPRSFDEDAWRRQVEAAAVADLYAPHRDAQGRFFNPWQPRERAWGDLLYWLLSANSLGAQRDQAPVVPMLDNDGAWLADGAAQPSIAWIGHATFAVRLGGPPVITDPFFGPRAGPVWRRTPPAFGPEKVPAGAVALISHNHYDHLDAFSVAALGPRVTFLVPLGLKELLGELGARQVRELDWWQSITIEGTTLTCLPAQHWSLRLGQGYNMSLWCSWLIERDGRRVFFGGDSGYFIGYREIGRRYPGIQAALLSVGAYLPRWFMHHAHLNPAEALAAAHDLGARRLVPGHWGTLQLGDEPVGWLPGDLARAGQGRPPGANPQVTILPLGGSLPLE
jgi:N-acyl-phosphatidylethanolamine-hydrolysing phospholipase D